ncbi:unnamed protein product, partial [Urochloa humidicola]
WSSTGDGDGCCSLNSLESDSGGSYRTFLIMFVRGSPKFNMMQGGSKQKMLSPRCGGVQKKRVSPTAAPKVDRKRASWNLGLEKGLVELLHYHNNDCYRGQNGWSSEAWNRIVKMFQERFSYVSFTKTQIQEKEKELKR